MLRSKDGRRTEIPDQKVERKPLPKVTFALLKEKGIRELLSVSTHIQTGVSSADDDNTSDRNMVFQQKEIRRPYKIDITNGSRSGTPALILHVPSPSSRYEES